MTDLTLLEIDTLTDCLDVCCAIYNKQRIEMMTSFYFDALEDLGDDLVTKAFKVAIDDTYFPTPARIRELVTGIAADADWHTIVAVANGTTKSATISGISAIALTTVTATANTLAAVKKIAFCDDPYTLREIRKDWTKLSAMPRLETALPPADVEITLTAKTIAANFDYPTDDNFSVRTASMIRCIREKESISPAWMPIIDKFPAASKREIYDLAKENNWVTPQIKNTQQWRRYESIAAAMREIDESAINEAIVQSRAAQCQVIGI